MSRCDNCKYWNPKNLQADYYEERTGLGECTKPKPFWNCTEWNEDSERKLKEEHKNDLMFVQDGSDYSAHLWTRPEFNCACFEQLDK